MESSARRLSTVALTACALVLSTVGGTGTATAQTSPQDAAAGLALTDLAVRGQGGFPQYRIPALTATTRGTLLAAYDGRPTVADLPDHIKILLRRSTDNGRTWSEQQVVREAPAPKGFGDPSLLVDSDTGRIFVFYAAGVNQGFGGSATGNDENDPDVLQTDYSYSDDDGLTWTSRRITAQIKDPSWAGMFAASGQGIQLRHGGFAGRLVQQYVIRIKGQNYAASAYSDDHGKTWKMGRPVGPGMDENKTVELADGTVMLNSRAKPNRLVAYSRDGGATYSPPQAAAALTDPADNGAIIRYAPEAKPSDPRSRWLLFVNNDDPALRRNLTVRMSCDSGKTWPVSRVVEKDSAAYATLTRQAKGRIGLFFERAGYQRLTYTSFGLDWLRGVCAPISVTKPDRIRAGSSDELRITVTNQETRTLPRGRLRVTTPGGWQDVEVGVPRLAPGRSKRVVASVKVPRTAFGDHQVTVRYESSGHRSATVTTLSVQADPAARPRPRLVATVVLDHLDAGGADGVVGDVVTYAAHVENTGNTTLTDVSLTGPLDGLDRCRYSALQPGQDYRCAYGTHTVTAADLDPGGFRPTLRLTGTLPDGSMTSRRVRVEPFVAPAESKR